MLDAAVPAPVGPPRADLDFRRLLDALPAAAYTCDADGLITYFNRRAVELWGREPRLLDPVDRYCGSFKLFAADGTPIAHDRCWMALALRDGREYVEQEILVERPDGTRRVALAHANPFRGGDGSLLGAMNVLVDVTERRRQEVETVRVNHTLGTLVAASPLPIAVIDADPPVVRVWNPAAERLFGWSAAEVLGRPIPIVPDDKLTECASYRTVIATGQPFANAETVRRRKDGAPVTVGLSAAALYDAGGRVGGILLMFTDLTERKRAEDALRESDRRKTEFLAMLAHELRNPLAPLRNGLQVMKLAPAAASAEQARAMMERQLAHMVRLIDDLLDMSRISSGKIELRRARIDLAAAVQDAVEAARPQVEAAGHDLTLALPPRPVFVDADRTRLAQVFANLLNNAAKYTPPGGHVDLTVEQNGSDAVVTVRDDGAGIPTEMLQKIFELFTQIDRNQGQAQGGLGIGLSLVRALVEMHGGSVEARSDGPGTGSEFVVRLPALLGAEREAGPADAGRTGAGAASRYRILVVDDNGDAADSLGLMLTIMGHEVRTANDGLEAVAAAGAFRPDVVLLDLGLPRLNGYEACRRIREQPWGADTVIIALTGWGQDDDKRRSKEAGFNFHLVKPVEPAALERLLAGLLVVPG